MSASGPRLRTTKIFSRLNKDSGPRGPIDARIVYGGHCYVPLLDVSDAQAGGGLYFFTADPTAQYKIITSRKSGVSGQAITMDNTFVPQGGAHHSGVLSAGFSHGVWNCGDGTATAGATWSMPTVHVGVHRSDWHFPPGLPIAIGQR